MGKPIIDIAIEGPKVSRLDDMLLNLSFIALGKPVPQRATLTIFDMYVRVERVLR